VGRLASVREREIGPDGLAPAVPQAGAVPVRPAKAGSLDVLLISRSSGGWGIPKGTLRADEGAAEAAARETLEEAGASGTLITPELGNYRYRKGGEMYAVQTYLMVVERLDRDWAEARRRRRAWVTLPEAMRLVEHAALRRLLRQARVHMAAHGAAHGTLLGAK
jgi:8-oxo-dGTP pyrophosphatase MutT (NUDIX family)